MTPGYTHNLLIVSDLHLSEGFSVHEGKFSRLEDFFSDQPFADFLKYHHDHREKELPWRLIIAGDLFDFLQVTALPSATPADLLDKINNWEAVEQTAYGRVSQPNRQARLADLEPKIAKIRQIVQGKSSQLSDSQPSNFQTLNDCLDRLEEKVKEGLKGTELPGQRVWVLEQRVLESWILANSETGVLSDRTKKYGLGTSWQETVWKLDRIAEGHSVFFEALGQFTENDNELFVMFGNHDIELYWPEVQGRLGQLLADAADRQKIEITFLPWVYYEPNLLYLEHGQQYEGANAFENILHPTVPGNEELIEFPPGSMLVRYLFNKIEEAYPFADNLRPITRFFSWAFQNELIKLVTIMFRYVGGFFSFVDTFLERSYQSYFKDRGERITLDDSLADLDRLNPAARSGLPDEILREIDTAAKNIRDGIFSRLRTLLLLLFVALLVLILLVITLGPFVYLLYSQEDSIAASVILPLISTVGGLLFKQWLAPKLLGMASGEHYLETAAERVADILKKRAEVKGKEEGIGPVPYLIFGHNHEPDIIRMPGHSAWYINTGSWLYSQGVVEEWLQQTKYHSFLKIVPGNEGAAPELRFWNAATKSAERIRLHYN